MKIIKMSRKTEYGQPVPRYVEDWFCVLEEEDERDAFHRASLEDGAEWAAEFEKFEKEYLRPRTGLTDLDIYYYLDTKTDKIPEIDEEWELDETVWERIR